MNDFLARPTSCGFIFVLLLSSVAMAYQQDRNTCGRDAEAARVACETKAIHAGFTDTEAASTVTLAKQIAVLNGKVGKIQNSQASQCDNQKALNDALSDMSERKARACLAALGSCMATCEAEQEVYEAEVKLLSIFGPNEDVQRKQAIVAERESSFSSCNGYKARALQALTQAQSAKKGSHQNAACQSTTSSLKNAANSSERGSQSGDAGSSGCTGPDGRTLDSCRSFKVADGSDEGRRGPGKFKPGGFSDGEWSAQSRDGSAGNLGSSASVRSGLGGAGRSGNTAAGAVGSGAGSNFGSKLGAGAASAGANSQAKIQDGRSPASSNSGAVGGTGNRNASGRGSRGDGELSGNELRELKERNGITGAGGPSIFQKVSRRYQIVRPAMLID
jgi:hypothetical protein